MKTGGPVEWQNKIFKYRVFDRGDEKVVNFCQRPTTIKYTTDGSNPKEYGGICDGRLSFPKTHPCFGSMEAQGIWSETIQIKIDRTKELALTFIKISLLNCIKVQNKYMAENYKADLLKKHGGELSDVIVTLQG